MARGDVIADVFSLDNNETHSIQPGSGVEWIVKCITLDDSSNGLIRGYDGTNVASGWDGVQSGNVAGMCTIPVNNTNYVHRCLAILDILLKTRRNYGTRRCSSRRSIII